MIKITDIIPFMCDGDYVAMQPNGDWYVYGSEPELKKDCWVAHSNTLCCISDAFDIAPADDWTKSLIKIDNTARKKFEEEYQNNIQRTIQELKQDE